MEGKEGFDLVKIAIGVLILVLVISAVYGLFNMLYTPSAKLEIDMETKATGAVMDKLYTIQDASNAADADASVMSTEEIKEAHPLVTQASNVISELSASDILFIYVCENKDTVTSNGWMFTYRGVTFSNTSVLPCPPSNTINDTDVPADMSVKHLLQYSALRCHLSVVNVDYNGQDFYGVIVEVLT